MSNLAFAITLLLITIFLIAKMWIKANKEIENEERDRSEYPSCIVSNEYVEVE